MQQPTPPPKPQLDIGAILQQISMKDPRQRTPMDMSFLAWVQGGGQGPPPTIQLQKQQVPSQQHQQQQMAQLRMMQQQQQQQQQIQMQQKALSSKPVKTLKEQIASKKKTKKTA